MKFQNILLILLIVVINCETLERKMNSDGLTNNERIERNRLKLIEEENLFIELQNEDNGKPYEYYTKKYGMPFEIVNFPLFYTSYMFAGRYTYLIFENNLLIQILDQDSFSEFKKNQILSLKPLTKRIYIEKILRTDPTDKQIGISEYGELFKINDSLIWIIYNHLNELKYTKEKTKNWDYRQNLFKNIQIGTSLELFKEISSDYIIDQQEGESKYALLLKIDDNQIWYIFNAQNKLTDIKERRIKTINDIEINLYKYDSAKFVLKNNIEIIDGSGCGVFGKLGKPEVAMNKLKGSGSSGNFDAIYVEKIIEPHFEQKVRVTNNNFNSSECFDNKYIIKAFGLRRKMVD